MSQTGLHIFIIVAQWHFLCGHMIWWCTQYPVTFWSWQICEVFYKLYKMCCIYGRYHNDYATWSESIILWLIYEESFCRVCIHHYGADNRILQCSWTGLRHPNNVQMYRRGVMGIQRRRPTEASAQRPRPRPWETSAPIENRDFGPWMTTIIWLRS